MLALLAQQGVPVPTGATPTPVMAPVATDPFPTVDWQALLPLMILGIGGILLLTVLSLLRGRGPSGLPAFLTVAVATAAGLAVVPLWARVSGWTSVLWWDVTPAELPGPFSTVGGMVGVDTFGLFVTVVLCAAVVLGALLVEDYQRREGLEANDLYALLLLSATGGVIMTMANDLIVLFLGLETLSVAAYVLAASHLKRFQSQEAGFKYFVLGAFSSAFFLYGIAMIYGATGTTSFLGIARVLADGVPAPIEPVTTDVVLTGPLLLLGVGMLLVGLGFKVAAVPFHQWAPDVYDGAPTPVVAFMAAGVKAAAFAAMVRVLMATFETMGGTWRPVLTVLAALSLVVGAFLAVVQTNVKRMLAYSSISHAGFILIAVQAASGAGQQAVLFYLAAYTFMVVGSFGVATVVAGRGDDAHGLDAYRGLGRANPGLALVFTLFLLAQAGVPLTVGFLAKFYAVAAAVQAGSTALAVLAMLASVVAAYLYLRIVATMWLGGADDEGPARERLVVPAAAKVALTLCALVTLGFGLFPGWLTDRSTEGRTALVEPAVQIAEGP